MFLARFCFYVQTFELYYPKVGIVSLVKVYAGVHYKGRGPGSHRQLQATTSSDHGILIIQLLRWTHKNTELPEL